MARRSDWHDPIVQRLMRERGGADPEQLIEAYAEEQLVAGDQRRFPIEVEGLASLLGIRKNVDDYPFAGRIYAEPSGQLVMDLNEGDHPRRRRFTCAHEIMHTAFPGFEREHRYRADDSTGSYQRNRSEEEYLCDRGAAALLLPSELVTAGYPAISLEAIQDLAEDAEASLEAAGNRLVDLSPQPAVFLVMELMHKPADRAAIRKGRSVPKQLRVRYARINGMNLFLPKFKSADKASALARALASPVTQQGVEHLPGAKPGSQTFNVEAKAFRRGDVDRVLAVATPEL